MPKTGEHDNKQAANPQMPVTAVIHSQTIAAGFSESSAQ
jgi:hypothetical protein